MSRSRVLRREAGGWEGVPPRAYKDEAEGHRGVARHLLLGGRAEASTSDTPFEARAFTVEPGGFTSRERHAHPHAVVVLSGRGSVLLGEGEEERAEALEPLDAVWVAPWEAHRFRADAGEPLTFLCVVPRVRDRPEPVEDGGDASGPAEGDA